MNSSLFSRGLIASPQNFGSFVPSVQICPNLLMSLEMLRIARNGTIEKLPSSIFSRLNLSLCHLSRFCRIFGRLLGRTKTRRARRPVLKLIFHKKNVLTFRLGQVMCSKSHLKLEILFSRLKTSLTSYFSFISERNKLHCLQISSELWKHFSLSKENS